MKVRSILSLATAVGLSVASAQAKDPGLKKSETPASTSVAPTTKQVANNQSLADAVAAQLRSSGLGVGASISIAAKNGVIELSGKVPSTEHGTQVIKTCMNVSGVTKVESTLEVQHGTLTRVSGYTPMEAMAQPMPQMMQQMGMMQQGGVMPVNMGGQLPAEPAPLAVPNSPQYDPNGPVLPANAWPTYAPYPNMSRVGYPEAYPYNAFPYIGPFYPFPKVPLGWRSVTLQWEDGHWYYGKTSTPHDYWRVRFW